MLSPLSISLHFQGMNEEPMGSLLWFEYLALAMRLPGPILLDRSGHLYFSYFHSDSEVIHNLRSLELETMLYLMFSCVIDGA